MRAFPPQISRRTYVAAGPVAAVALLEEEADTAVGEDSLLHGEALLVVSSGDPHHVALELVPEGVGLHLLAHALLVERSDLRKLKLNFLSSLSSVRSYLQLISNLHELLTASGWERKVDFHFSDFLSL